MNKQDGPQFNVGDQVQYVVTGTIEAIEKGYATLKDMKVNGIELDSVPFCGEVDWVRIVHLRKAGANV